MAYQVMPSDTHFITIPDTCKSSYTFEKPRIAVVEFSNNTGYGDMKAQNTQFQGESETKRVSGGVAGVVATPGAVGVGYVGASKTDHKYSGSVDTYMRDISPKVGEYAQNAVETTVHSLGGMEVFDRTNLQKIMSEHKFQMTVGDPDTAVQLGKLAGVEYIFTGSVDSISAKYVPKSSTRNNQAGWLGAAMSLTAMAANTQSGWIVNVEMTTKMLDVSTGQVIINRKVQGREVAGGGKALNPELIVSAAKKAMGEAVADLNPELSQKFAPGGYIKQIRGGKKVALVNMGFNNGLEAGQSLAVYDIFEVKDPFTQESACNMAIIPIEVIVSNQIQEDQAWVELKGEPAALERVKVGSLIRKSQEKGQSVLKKMF
ncbi:CsgG/HfaB family protein [Limisalsivibrio acetivorans]|uniref:CsgG/HfaB family protein n=1 Tax=Limisalsivibrio acetivorans TaxID=1304888 RepID=UPI001EE16361|nr:CsgG/HfaB family protein [Limisalsivibrio acetivorans]